MLERIRAMLIKEFLQTLRDPRMLRVLLLVPVVQTLIFGYAVTTDIRRIPTGIYDLDNSVPSRELVSRFLDSGYFVSIPGFRRDADVQRGLDQGEAKAVLQIDPGFGADLQAGRTVTVQLLVDGSDSNTAGIILSYAGEIAGQFNSDVLRQRQMRLQGQIVRPASVDLQSRAWFNTNLESRNFFVPGVIALLLMLITLMLASMAIVREKEIGTIEQILVTPITQWEFILGKTVPFAVIAFLNVILILLVAVFWFEIPVRGSVPLLFVASGLYLGSTLGAGLFISTVSRTQQQAMMTTFLIFFPCVLLSGFMFPIENMPEVVQWITYLNPLRYFLVIVRGIFLKGIGLQILWPQMFALGVLGAILLWLASLRFSKTMA